MSEALSLQLDALKERIGTRVRAMLRDALNDMVVAAKRIKANVDKELGARKARRKS